MITKLRIQQDKKGRAGRGAGRRFEVELLGYVVADRFWDCPGARDSKVRPVWIAYLGTDQESQAFTANLRGGRPAVNQSQALVLPKKRGLYRWAVQKLPGGVLTMAYLPELFHLDPGRRGEDVRFLFAPPRWWIEEQVPTLEIDHGDDAADVARAALFTAYLDRRSPMPILNDLRFHLQLWRAAQKASWLRRFELSSRPPIATSTSWIWGWRTPRWGLEDPLAVRLSQDDLNAFLVHQTSIFYKEHRRGPHRLPADRRILPNAQGPFEQLRLDFEMAA